MRKVMLAAVAAGLLTAAAAPTTAGIPIRVETVCPVDDQKFTWTTTASYSTWGMELDGKPIGSWHFPMTIPQCPDSKFPVYQEEWTAAEKAAIRALVATPEYAAVKDEASYYLLRFVAERLMPADAEEPVDDGWLLLQATWQVRDDPDRYARYAGELVRAVDAAGPALKSEEVENWWFFNLATANVQRQAGDFAGASARLDMLSGEPPERGDFAARIALTRQLIETQDRKPTAPPDPDRPDGEHDH